MKIATQEMKLPGKLPGKILQNRGFCMGKWQIARLPGKNLIFLF